MAAPQLQVLLGRVAMVVLVVVSMTVTVPAGFAAFPREILRPPRSMAARVYTDLRRWTAMPKGGHFAAMEEPELFVEDVRTFFRTVR